MQTLPRGHTEQSDSCYSYVARGKMPTATDYTISDCTQGFIEGRGEGRGRRRNFPPSKMPNILPNDAASLPKI